MKKNIEFLLADISNLRRQVEELTIKINCIPEKKEKKIQKKKRKIEINKGR